MKGRDARSWWVESFLRPVLIAGMLVCLAAPITLMMEELTRAEDGTSLWDGTYFLVFAFFASLEGILSERVLLKRRITGWGYLASRGAEVVLLLLILKLANYIPLGLDQLWADALSWASDPYHFVSFRDMVTGALFLPLWVGSLYVARMVRELDAEEHKASPPPDKTSPDYYLWLTQPPVTRHRQEALTWLAEAILWGGVAILLVSTGLHFLAPHTGAPSVAVLLYFALGVALLSQARFSVTYAGWQTQGISIQPGIGRRWLLWAVVFLVAVVLVALLLPTHYSVGPLQALLGLFSMLYAVLSFIVSLIFFLLTLPLALLLPGVERPAPPALDLSSLPAQEPAASVGPSAWLQTLGSALFWLLVLFIVGYALYRFWRDRSGLLSEVGGEDGTLWGRFLTWLRDLWRRWRTWGHEVQVRLARGRAEPRGEGSVAARFTRFFFPGRLPPRELIRYFYLSTARRAAQAGQPRGPEQTPYEYRAALDQQFPELEPDLEGLTEAFVEARYSHRPVRREDAAVVKSLWQRIKAALQRRRIRLH